MLFGVGVGPGDPELVTLRALAVLRAADVVVVPVRDDIEQVGYAERVVRHHLPAATIVRAPFALTERHGVTDRRSGAWEAAAELILAAFDRGARQVGFATIGDPNVFSTYAYLAATVRSRRPTVVTRTVAGITAMQALAAASDTVLCEGREPLVLFPAAGDPGLLGELLGDPLLTEATIVAYKGGRHWPALREMLAASGRLDDAVVGSHLGRQDERVVTAAAVAGEIPYLSTVVAPARRAGRGERLT